MPLNQLLTYHTTTNYLLDHYSLFITTINTWLWAENLAPSLPYFLTYFNSSLVTDTTITLTEKWKLLKKAHPDIRIRDAANYLSVSEAQLLLTQTNSQIVPLCNNFAALITQLPALGKVKILTRNNHAVHIQEGRYPQLNGQQIDTVSNTFFDLKLILKDWQFGFAVTYNQIKTLQFFNKFGTAVHKIHLLPESNRKAYQNIIEQYQLPKSKRYTTMDLAQKTMVQPKSVTSTKVLQDRMAFNLAWQQLNSPCQFQALLKQFNLTPLQALRWAPKSMAQCIPNSMTRKVFQLAIQRKEPLVITVCNKSCAQRYTGKIQQLKSKSEWLSLKGKGFKFYIREINISESWLVCLPSKNGMTTSLEIFDEQGISIASISGKQSDSLPELDTWRRIWTTINGNS